MNKLNLWNNYEMPVAAGGMKITIPFGTWPWNKKINQTFCRIEAEKIAAKLDADVAAGEPGIPVYQGHPDVPELAAKYPDKGALGWVKKIEVRESGCVLNVEWDRFPGKGFAWFSPYWGGKPIRKADGTVSVTVEEIRSIGLVNRPNIHAFRLPNEELDEAKKEQQMKEILAALGLGENATTEEAVAAIGKLKGDAEAKVALEDECNKQKCCNEELQKKLTEAEAALVNSKSETEKAKTALANEQAEVEKLKALKTASVTAMLANEKPQNDTRLGLVNEIMAKKQVDFDHAWAMAKNEKPELFKK